MKARVKVLEMKQSREFFGHCHDLARPLQVYRLECARRENEYNPLRLPDLG